jgi:hypothetical protein
MTNMTGGNMKTIYTTFEDVRTYFATRVPDATSRVLDDDATSVVEWSAGCKPVLYGPVDQDLGFSERDYDSIDDALLALMETE